MLVSCLTCASELTPKAISAAITTSCCGKPICYNCQSDRPRLKYYCVFCQTGVDAVSSAVLEKQLGEEDQFVIGDDEVLPEEELPPPYAESSNASSSSITKDSKDDKPCNLHYIQPHETFQGISFSYGISPRQLASLNILPTAVLTTQPNLLHTRAFLILPPGLQSASSVPLRSEVEERKRLLVRQFMMKTKVIDQKVAELYMNQVHESRQKESESSLRHRGTSSENTERGGELEEALQAYQADLAWEKQAKEQGKYTGPRLKGKGVA